MNPLLKLYCTVRNLLNLSVTLLVMLSGSALAQVWTLEKDQLVEQPKPYSPYVDQHFPQRVFFGVDMGEDTKMTIQDRAYTSPIWYTP